MELELQRLDRKYAGLRVLAADRLGSLVASLAEVGQQSPVLVVLTSPTTAVLIDGYRRVAALDKLGRDTVQAVAVELSEPDALLMRHELAAVQQRSALEDGWLLRELLDSHRLSQGQLGARLGRSVSWVSRRLGLARDLPECVQDLVRHGWVTPHSASKELLSLARANTQACKALAQSLAGARWSVRQIADIYAGWRKYRKHLVTRRRPHGGFLMSSVVVSNCRGDLAGHVADLHRPVSTPPLPTSPHQRFPMRRQEATVAIARVFQVQPEVNRPVVHRRKLQLESKPLRERLLDSTEIAGGTALPQIHDYASQRRSGWPVLTGDGESRKVADLLRGLVGIHFMLRTAFQFDDEQLPRAGGLGDSPVLAQRALASKHQ